MNQNFKKHLLKNTNAADCKEIEVMQTLWSGYGKISRYQLFDSSISTVVVKCISPNSASEHPRGWDTNFSHQRKVKSYNVETHWYEAWSIFCNPACRVPKFIMSFAEGGDQWIVMEDLNDDFPLRKNQLKFSEVQVCLKWLANFHMNFLSQRPVGLWEVGTYWHLDTRPDEFEKIEHQELKSQAHAIDTLLNQCEYQTIVHGDAKLANFCFSENGQKVAAVDFQYVGGGCGMKDVAYFLGSCLTSDELKLHQDALLDYYFIELETACRSVEFDLEFKDLEHEWRRMYPIACTDFIRFLFGWMPSHQKVNDYSLKMMESVLADL